MKNLYASALLFIALLASCGSKSGDISEMKDATPADSMMYYFGMMQANNYLHDGESDTLFLTEKGKEAFMKGFRKGLNSDKDDPCFNKGYQEGLRLAIRLREFEQQYGTTFPKDMLADAMEAAIQSKEDIDVAAAQKAYYKIKDRLDVDKVGREKPASEEALAKAAKKLEMTMVSDSLYAKDITAPGKGPKFKDGDKIDLQLNAATLNGQELGRQFPSQIVLGEGRVPAVVRLAIYTMTDGQTRTFLSTPQAMFGHGFEKYHLTPSDPVVFTIKANKAGK